MLQVIQLEAGATEFAAYYNLRWRVLREPWDQPRGSERDELEDTAEHVAAVDSEGVVIGVGRLQLNSQSEAQIRYMAVAEEARGQGVGRALMERLESMARQHDIEKIVLNARDDVIGFYERLGFRVVGVGPTVFGVLTHSRMEKQVQKE